MGELNDLWASAPSTGLLRRMEKDAGVDSRLLETVVEIAEVDTIKYRQSPALHFFLASLYQRLPQELTLEEKERIERLKLREKGKENLLDIPSDEAYSLAIQGKLSFSDYSELFERSLNLREWNAARAVLHLTEAIEKSRDNPEPYKNILGITLTSFLLDKRTRECLVPVYIALKH